MQPSSTGLRAGVAKTNITPSLETDSAFRIFLSGYVARLGHALGVHDPLHARALALSDGSRQAMLVVCDLLGLEAAFSTQIRREIANRTGTPVGAVMLACIHTHSSPATMKLHECGKVSPDYLETLRPQLINVASRAAASMQSVTLDVASASLPDGAYNRRGDGQAIDTEIGIARLRTLEGETLATLVNYGCHPVVMNADNLWISADYPGVVTRTLEATTGGTAFFLTGADGNVDPVRRGGFADTEWLGQNLARAVSLALTEIEDQSCRPTGQESTTIVTAANEVLTLPLLPVPSSTRLTQLRAQYRTSLAAVEPSQETVEAKIQRAMLAWADETLALVQCGAVPSTTTAEIQIIRAGSLALIGIPGEIFSGLGKQIKAGLPGYQTLIIGYANGDAGYIPDRTAYAGGGYEVNDAFKYYGYPAALAPAAGEMIVRRSIQLAQSHN